ncbi:hypothetical protein [Moraxella lacunata]
MRYGRGKGIIITQMNVPVVWLDKGESLGGVGHGGSCVVVKLLF